MAGVNPNQVWNLCILALFAALVGSRLLLVVVNLDRACALIPPGCWRLAMVHHPLLAAVGALLARSSPRRSMRVGSRCRSRNTADALAAPLALGLAFEQFGRAAGRLGLRNRNNGALGSDLHQSAGCALERHAARRSAASGAGLCGAGFSYALRSALLVWLPRSPAAGRHGRAVA